LGQGLLELLLSVDVPLSVVVVVVLDDVLGAGGLIVTFGAGLLPGTGTGTTCGAGAGA
jgi:hypothetical protein